MRTKYSIKNSITSLISNIISYIFLFIGQTLFIKILGIEYTGLNGLFSNILTLLSLIELGLGSAIIYNLYKSIAKNDVEEIKTLMNFYKKTYNLIAFIIFIVGLGITPFLKCIIKDIRIDINLYVVYILYLISTVSTYLIAYKRNLIFAYQRNYIINIIHVIYLLILNIFQILIIYITKNYYLYLIIKIVCILFENTMINIKVNKDYPYLLDKNINKLDKNIKEDIVSRVKALFIHKSSLVVTQGTDNVLISLFLGISYVGLYTNYYYIINTVSVLFRSVIESTTASVGNLLTNKDYKRRYEIFRKIKFLNFWIATLTSVCLILLIEPFISLWLGKKYILGKLVLYVLVFNYFQNMMRTTYSIFKDSAGIWIEDRYVPLIQMTLNIISSVILLKIYGLAGIFIGTIISSLAVWFYSYPLFVYSKLFKKKIKEYFSEMIKNMTIFIIILSISVIISKLIIVDENIIKLIINTFVSIFFPNILLYIIYKNTDEFKYYKSLIFNIIRGKK